MSLAHCLYFGNSASPQETILSASEEEIGGDPLDGGDWAFVGGVLLLEFAVVPNIDHSVVSACVAESVGVPSRAGVGDSAPCASPLLL